MNCHVTTGEGQEVRSGASIYRNRYFNSEIAFCRVYAEEVLQELERLFLWNQISYFIVDDHDSLLARIFSTRRHCWTIRINANDLDYALWLAEDLRGVEIIAQPQEHDWSPAEAKRLREEAGGREAYFGRYRRA